MRLKPKYKLHLYFLSFILLVGAMVVLNNNVSKKNDKQENNTENVVSVAQSKGLAPISVSIPINHEGALPISLISNPFSNFILFVNKSVEFEKNFKIKQLDKEYLDYCADIGGNFFIVIISTARNKGFR